MTNTPQDYINERRFDYVIVGAGPSAIGVLLGLLDESKRSNRKPYSIAVVERGGRVPDPSTLDLRQWYPSAHPGKETNSVRPLSTQMTGRKMDLPTGQGLGGTSNINAGIVMPPILPDDFQAWPEPWKSSMPRAVDTIWKRLDKNGMLHRRERTAVPTSTIRGSNGWTTDWKAPSATLEVSQVNPDGASTWKRINFYDALVAPLLGNDCHLDEVEWILHTEVQRLLFDGNGEEFDTKQPETRHINGVECLTENREGASVMWHLFATRAIIICAGAIETPALLLASGIGPDFHPSFHGVGRHLRDQWLVPRVHLTCWQSHDTDLSTNGIAALGHLRAASGQLFQVAIADSVCHETVVPSTLALAIRRKYTAVFFAPAIELAFRALTTFLRLLVRFPPVGYLLRSCTRTTLLFMMHPRSEGAISIELKRRAAPPAVNYRNPNGLYRRRRDIDVKVDVGYCRDPSDVEAMHSAWKSLDSSTKDGSKLDMISKLVIHPLKWFGLDGFAIFCRLTLQPYFHFSGSCSMQRDDQHFDWVVDAAELRLRDYRGLHICDASVFPSMVSSPPALTCCALGFAFGKMLAAKKSDLVTGLT